jgi:hypothetical protein
MSKFQDVMRVIFPAGTVVDADVFKGAIQAQSSGSGVISQDDTRFYDNFGIFPNNLKDMMQSASQVNFERMNLYQQIDRAQKHWLVQAGVKLFAEVATNYNQIQNATVWITSSSKDYELKLMRLLEYIGMEEKIYDLAKNSGSYGDMFYKLHGETGKGIVSVNDDFHPSSVCRLDHNGRLIGFYMSEFEANQGMGNGVNTSELLPPWAFVHFRLLGATRRRPNYFDPSNSEFRSVTMGNGNDSRTLSAKYGCSLVSDSLADYRRLRLAEDSLLMARLARTPLKYLYKLKVSGNNNKAIGSLVRQYTEILKKARSIDTGSSAKYTEVDDYLNGLEDILIPVTGEVGDLSAEKLGGDVDIKYVVDIEAQRNQLATSMSIPLQMLGNFMSEMPGGLNTSALETVDIRFARAARRLQRSLINGITRMCQVHLAYMGENPDAKLFQVHMAETSTAEENELKEALDKGTDIVQKFADMIVKNFGDSVDKTALFNYLNTKILKLNDFDLRKILKTPTGVDKMLDSVDVGVEVQKLVEAGANKEEVRERFVHNTDLFAHLPCDKNILSSRSLTEWNQQFGDKTVLFEKKFVSGGK